MGCQQRAGRKVLQGTGMILKGRMQIGLAGMAGITCLGEQREVGQAVFFNDGTVVGQFLHIGLGRMKNARKQGQNDQYKCSQEANDHRRWAHHSHFRMAATIVSDEAPRSITWTNLPSGPMT